MFHRYWRYPSTMPSGRTSAPSGSSPARPAGPPLAQQVPALVEGDLQLPQLVGRLGVEPLADVLLLELVLLLHQGRDASEKVVIVHW